MKMKKSISVLPVQDIEQSIGFYTNKLGFTVRHHGGRQNINFFLFICESPLMENDLKWQLNGMLNHPSGRLLQEK